MVSEISPKFKTERLIQTARDRLTVGRTDEQTDLERSTPLVMMIQNIHTSLGRIERRVII